MNFVNIYDSYSSKLYLGKGGYVGSFIKPN